MTDKPKTLKGMLEKIMADQEEIKAKLDAIAPEENNI
jgi:hypothetical protein